MEKQVHFWEVCVQVRVSTVHTKNLGVEGKGELLSQCSAGALGVPIPFPVT